MKQISNTIMMIRPKNFGFNEQTAENNSFQNETSETMTARDKAIEEFDEAVEALQAVGVRVIVVEDTESPSKPDAIFPNNWISFHEDGFVITYPMFAENRRRERREDIVEDMMKEMGYVRRYSLEFYEEEGKYLEGTGSMILDRQSKVVYACISPRTHVEILDKFAVLMGYDRVVFHAYDAGGELVYHTNVVMAMGVDYAVVCLESIRDEEERKQLTESLESHGKKIIPISIDQMNQFAGNMLQVAAFHGPLLVMSQAAYDSLSNDQIATLKEFNEILTISIPTIEKVGGGSIRCMMAEVFYS